MELIIPILLNCLLVLGIYLYDKHTAMQKWTYIQKQIVIGVLFGGTSAFASSFGVEWLGTIVNVRDAAPLSAGLIFGAPAGIIAGCIGGLYRFFSVYWGGGTYTQLACSLATILAGIMAAVVRKWMFDNKKPNWIYGVCIAIVCEVLHMILIFITNMDNASYAFEFVMGATIPMVIGNACAVGISLLTISLFNKERNSNKAEGIANTFQRWLLICIVVAFIATSSFTYILQNGIVKVETQEVFTSAINDVENDVRDKLNEFIQVGYDTDQLHKMLDEFVIDVTKNRHVGSGGFVAVCDDKLNLLIDNEYFDKPISTIGIIPPTEMLNGETATTLYDADIIDGINELSEKYTYVFKFVEGYCIIAAMPKAEVTFMRNASVYTSVFMQILIFATLFVFIYVLIKCVIINNIKRVNSSLGRITGGDLNVTVEVRTNEEFASLSDDINSTVSTLKQYIVEAAARIDKELEYAKQIQLSALPTNFPTDEEYGIFAQMIAAKEVGGDFYDFYKLDNNTIAVLVADVSGKGIPAAMFMMRAKTIIKNLAESGLPVNEIFTKANDELCENNEFGMFVTAWMGVMDIPTGKMRFANAGHNPPLIKRANGAFEYLKTSAGFVLAGMGGMQYVSGELTLYPGDRLFLYTDGVTEAVNMKNNSYGENRLLEICNQNRDIDAVSFLSAVKTDLDDFVGETPQFDDITMLMFDYKAKKVKLQTEEKIFSAKTEKLSEVLDFVESFLEKYQCPTKTKTSICVAIEEVFVNIARYAYEDSAGSVTLGIGFEEESRMVTFRIADKGVPFNPLKVKLPDITLSAQEREIGGLGIFITRKSMDSVEYVYENGENILTMRKKI